MCLFLINLLSTSLFIIFISVNSAAQAEIYRWIDQEGRTHMSDKAPENETIKVQVLEAQDIKINTVSEEESAKQGRQNYLDNMSGEQKQMSTEEENQAKVDAKTNAACRQMEIDLKKLNNGKRLYSTDEAGERKYMDDDTRESNNTELTNRYNETCRTYQPRVE